MKVGDVEIEDWYSGLVKNSVSLKINEYNYIDPTRWTRGDFEGPVRYTLYLNLDLVLKPYFLTGVIRIMAVREPIDDRTAYQDFTVSRKNCPINSSSIDNDSPTFDWLFTHEWMGAADKDYDKLSWQVSPGPEFKSAKFSTRYAKIFH